MFKKFLFLILLITTFGNSNGVVSLPVEVADQFLPLETAGLLVNTGLDIAGDGLNSIATDLSGNPNWLDENHLTRDAFDGVLVIGGVSTAAGGLGSKTGVVSKVDDVVVNTNIHKNSNCYGGNCTLYQIDNATTGTPYKIGETAVPANSQGVLPRPQSQVNKLNKTNTGKYEYQKLSDYPGKQAVREVERSIIESTKAKNPEALPGNKSYH